MKMNFEIRAPKGCHTAPGDAMGKVCNSIHPAGSLKAPTFGVRWQSIASTPLSQADRTLEHDRACESGVGGTCRSAPYPSATAVQKLTLRTSRQNKVDCTGDI